MRFEHGPINCRSVVVVIAPPKMLSAPKSNAVATGVMGPALTALLLALIMSAANLFEPVAADDVCHHYYAEQVLKQPLQPFGFEPLWHQKPVAAWTIMVAPVHSYYWAPGLWLFGDSVVGWHLWFLPVHWLFCYSLCLLLRRWLRRGAGLLTAVIALGPAVLPGLNLMLEVPMLSLALTSLVLLQRAMDRHSKNLAIAAGLLWGLAFQTKYSAMAMFPPWCLLAVLRWQWREWFAGFASAIATALAVEVLIGLSHGGGSYFMQQLSDSQMRVWSHLWKGMFQHVGLLAIPAVLLAMVGFGARRWHFVTVIACYAAGILAVGFCPDRTGATLLDGAVDSIAYVFMSSITWIVLVAMLVGLARSGIAGLRSWRVCGSRRMRLFLVCWCLCEICSSFVVSPFPAARRVLMVVVAFTVTAGWLAIRKAGCLPAVRSITLGAAMLGLSIQGLDLLEGRAWTDAAHGTMAHAQQHYPGAKLYFTGGWGFEFYAPRAGMLPFLEGRSQLQAGDLIAVGSIDRSELPWFGSDARLPMIEELDFGQDGVPWSTQFAYYSGQRPIDSQVGARFVVRLLQATTALHASELACIPDRWAAPGDR